MSMASDMNVTLRLPTRTLFEGHATRMTAVAPNGAFGHLAQPCRFRHRAGAVGHDAAPCRRVARQIFRHRRRAAGEEGPHGRVAVLRGVQGDDLGQL